MNNSKLYRIFSCDGGGFRGYLTSKVLEAIENKLNKNTKQQIDSENSTEQTESTSSRIKLSDCFDMYAGTSTGALIACGLASGKTTAEIKKIYEEDGELIFPKINWSKEVSYRFAQIATAFNYLNINNVASYHRFHFSHPLFDGKELEKAINKRFSDYPKFGDLVKNKNNKRVIVTAYDCYNSLPVIFDTSNEEDRELELVNVLLASSAYPGGFPAHSISIFNKDGTENKDNRAFLDRLCKQPGWTMPSDNSLSLADGGLIANNPTLVALSEFLSTEIDLHHHTYEDYEWLSDLPRVMIASFGTGKLMLKFDAEDSTSMGLADWTFPLGDPLLEVVYGGYSRTTDRITFLLLKVINKGRDEYFRFQPFISGEKEDSRWRRILKNTKLPFRKNRYLSNSFQTIGKASSFRSLSLPDLVRVSPQERKDYESATFQYTSQKVLDEIANRYLCNSLPLKKNLENQGNQSLLVNQRVEKLVSAIQFE